MDDAATLHQLNLKDNTMTVLANSTSDPQLTSALALDGVTDRLWLSDQSNGNILSCDTSTEKFNCQVEVNTTLLLNSTAKSKFARSTSFMVVLMTNYFSSVNFSIFFYSCTFIFLYLF